MSTDGPGYLGQLRQLIDETFNLADIGTLCLDLAIDYEHLAGNEKLSKINALLLYLARRQRLPELITRLREVRPHIKWPDVPPDDVLLVDVETLARETQGVSVKAEIIAGGDVKNASLINTGDITGSLNAIGTGAQVIVNQVQAFSPAEELGKETQLAERRLNEAITSYMRRYLDLQAPADDKRRNPYKSLLSYELEDASFFYGRERAIAGLLDKIHENRLTILHADSGAGKSSLLKAGVASRLLAAGHFPLHSRPYNESPVEAIKQALLPDVATLPELARLAELSLRGFLERVSRHLGRSKLYIFLDQFEEFFRELRSEQQKAFARALAACLKQPGPDVRWVLSMRKEAFADLDVFRPFIPAPYENDYFLQAFDLEEATHVIVEPAAKQGVTYEAGLVDTILQDLRPQAPEPNLAVDSSPANENPDGERLAPPQVQLVCYTLFDEWKWDGNRPVITRALYEKPRGNLHQRGAEGILNSHLSSVLERMKGADRTIARQVLEALVTSRKSRVILDEDRLLNELQQNQQSIGAGPIQAVLATLVDSRLLRSAKDNQDKTRYELAHDYLLSQIELDPATQARKAAQEMLNQEVIAWGNNDKLRIPADKLDIIEAQEARLVLSPEARTLINLSRKALARRQRLVLAGSGFALLLLVVAVISVVTAVGAQGLASQAQDTLGTATVQLAAAEAQQTRAAADIATATAQLGTAVSQQADAESAAATATVALAEAQAEQVVAEAAIATATRQIDALSREAASIGFAIQALDNTDPEQQLLMALKAANVTLQSGQETPWQTQRALLQALSTPLWKVLEGHTGEVLAIDVSPDGRYIASGGRDGAVRIWETETGQLNRFLEVGEGTKTVAFSPNSRYLVTDNLDNMARVWEVETGQLLHEMPQNSFSSVLAVAFSPDSRYVVTGDGEGMANIWQVESGDLVRTLAWETTGRTNIIAFNPVDGRSLVIGGNDGTVRIWDVETGALKHTLPQEHRFWAVAYHPDGRSIATGGEDGTVEIWEAETGQLLQTFDGAGQAILTVAFTPPQGRYLIAGDEIGRITIWEVETGERSQSLFVNPEILTDDLLSNVVFGFWSVLALDISPDGRYLVASRSDDTAATVWEVETGRLVQKLMVPAARPQVGDDFDISARLGVIDIAFSSDGRHVITGSADGLVRMWEVDGETGLLLHSLPEQANAIGTIAMSPDGRYMATSAVAEDLTVADEWTLVWEVETGQLVHTLEGAVEAGAFDPQGRYVVTHSILDRLTRVWEVDRGQLKYTLTGDTSAFSSDGRYLVTATGFDGVIWDMATGDMVRTLEEATITESVYFTSDGRYVIGGSGFGSLTVWNADTGAVVHDVLAGTSPFVNRVEVVATSPTDGRYAVITNGDGSALVWNVETGQLMHTLPEEVVLTAHARTFFLDLVFSPDGQFVLTGSEDNTARIWEVETAHLVHELSGHESAVTAVAYTSDGRYAVTGDTGGGIHVWEAQSGLLMHAWSGDVQPINTLAFTPDGRYLITGGGHAATGDAAGLTQIWRFDAALLVEQVKPRIRPSLLETAETQ